MWVFRHQKNFSNWKMIVLVPMFWWKSTEQDVKNKNPNKLMNTVNKCKGKARVFPLEWVCVSTMQSDMVGMADNQG